MKIPRHILFATISLVFIMVFSFGWQTQSVNAATFNVGTTAELIAAIITAQSNGAADTITLEDNIILTSDLPQISTNITIEGSGFTIDGNNTYQLFRITGGTLLFNDVTLTGGIGSICIYGRCGGAIYSVSGGTLEITNSTISDNAVNDLGGGIFHYAG